MEAITVKNFFGIDDIDLEIKDFTIFIGEDKGKRVLVQLIHFCRQVLDHIHIDTIFRDYSYSDCVQNAKASFNNIFAQHQWINDDFEIMYYFNDKELHFKKIDGGTYSFDYELGDGEYSIVKKYLTPMSTVRVKQVNNSIIEEPESHLHPSKQVEIAEFYTKLHCSTNMRFLFITHSPYILTAFNNFIYAHNVASSGSKRTKEKVESVIPSELHLPYEHVAAYKIEEGEARDIMMDKMKMIGVSAIDKVSDQLEATSLELRYIEEDSKQGIET